MRKTVTAASVLTSLLLIAVSASVSIWIRTEYPVTAYAPPQEEVIFCGPSADDRVAGRVGCASLARTTNGGSTVFLAPAKRN